MTSMTREKQNKFIKSLLKSRKKIVINKKLLKSIDCEDYREFIIVFRNWVYSSDFTYQDYKYTKSFNTLLRAWLKELLTN
jgi:hypothetical protein